MTKDELKAFGVKEDEYERNMEKSWHSEKSRLLHDDAEICTQCHGSGEGYCDGTSCDYCDGKGMVAL